MSAGANFAVSGQSCVPGQQVIGMMRLVTFDALSLICKCIRQRDFGDNQRCPVGQLIRGVDEQGNVICAEDNDTDTLYSAGLG